VAALGAYLAGVHELAILAGAGLAAVAWSSRGRLGGGAARLGVLPWTLAAAVATGERASSWRLLVEFLRIGSVLYGSGYVLLAFLQRRLVDDLGWLTEQQVLDAVTVGQITPGPVFTTATFVGWQIAGPLGAAAATAGIFGPSFAFVAVLGPVVRWMRRHEAARAALAGVTVASLALMAGVTVQLAGDALVDPLTVTVALVAWAVLVTTPVNSAWLVGAGALLGLAHAVVTV
jgi:chromate transporter